MYTAMFALDTCVPRWGTTQRQSKNIPNGKYKKTTSGEHVAKTFDALHQDMQPLVLLKGGG